MICLNCAFQPIFVFRHETHYDQTYCPQCGTEGKTMLAQPRKRKLDQRPRPQLSKKGKGKDNDPRSIMNHLRAVK